ncbi:MULTISPECIES: hypothetical protein [Sporosarcina]|uniref:Uncharacterized protein n=1 Tax=Sporosarcina contaminans TaxID=633403 RepID=A0ABW3TYE0_9BACL
MKIRGILLIALLIGGAYAMIQSINDYNEKKFAELLQSADTNFQSLVFSKPQLSDSPSKTWIVDDPEQVDELLNFLQHYDVKKLKPEEIDIEDDIDQFSISLTDNNGNSMTVIITENLIIQNSMLYYKIVNDDLDMEWIARFFAENQL